MKYGHIPFNYYTCNIFYIGILNEYYIGNIRTPGNESMASCRYNCVDIYYVQ